jgi:hypothetical protein
MENKELFRVGLTISPSGLYNIGVTHGDWREGCDFVHTIAPLITDFSERFKDAYQKWVSEKVTACGEEPRKKSPASRTKPASRTREQGKGDTRWEIQRTASDE